MDPGRVTIHQLNRAEYDNTVRDLLGDTRRPAREFPSDDRGYGYDNNADVLSLAPLLMENYEAAAERLADEAWARDHSEAVAIRVEAEAATASTGVAAGTAWNLYLNGTLSATVRFEQSGEHTLFGEAACARGTFEAFALRAWRRRATPAELDRLMSFTAMAASNGDGRVEVSVLELGWALPSESAFSRSERGSPESGGARSP